MNNFIDAILYSYWLWLVARVLLAVVFISSGLAKLIDFEGSLNEMKDANLEPAILFNIVTAAILLIGPALLLLDRALWLGAGALSVFLLLTILIVHHFWILPEPYARQALLWALEHTAVIGGLIATAIASRLRQRLGLAKTLQSSEIRYRRPMQ